MNRRIFSKGLMGSSLMIPLLGLIPTQRPAEALVKPTRLRPGDTIGLITPGSFAPEESVQRAISNATSLGLKVKLGKHLQAERGFIAGTDAQRLEDLHAMFADPEVKGIWCVRGGYGCTRLLPQLDFDLIRRNPKVFIGYSDITALHQAIFRETGLICFHGPVGSSTLTPFTREQLVAVLMEAKSPHAIKLSSEQLTQPDSAFQPFVIKPGVVIAPLSGGNLSLLAAMAGTRHAFDFSGKLVFIEEVGERPYRVDRMLTTLLQSSNLDQAAGIALGLFTDCHPKKDERSLSLKDTLLDRLGNLNMPMAYGLSFGHVSDNCTLPVGLTAKLDTDQYVIELAEQAVL
jgi:muramoyltetrapeptide carboxypeptidase